MRVMQIDWQESEVKAFEENEFAKILIKIK